MSITPKQAEALQMQDEGLTYKQIADLLGITETAVQLRLARARHHLGIPVLRHRRPATGPTQRQEQVLEMRSKGLTYRQVAAKLAINRETVKQHIRNARIRAEEQTIMSERPETYTTHDKSPFPVSGIWLRRIGDEAQVLFEHNGKWYMGIQEHIEGNFSYIMEPLGMRARVEKGEQS